MKELTATARNIIGTPNREGNGFTARGELILIVSEPSYRLDASGQLIRERGALETMRCTASAAGFRDIATVATEIADEIDKLNEAKS